MGTGTEGAARIDHDGLQTGVGILPRRADPQATDTHRVMEGAPCVFPPRLDGGDADVVERSPDRLDGTFVDVERDRQPAIVL